VLVPMRDRHLTAVCAIETAANPRPWSRSLFAAELRQPNAHCIVALREPAEVVAFGCLMNTGAETHVTNIATDERWRRHGYAAAILCELMEVSLLWGVESMTLEVRASNEGAKELYRRAGFLPAGIRPRYYSDNEDALILWATDLGSEPMAERRRTLRSEPHGRSATVG
jgi:ribosomal-protein-alanine N-acetyltransferase